ncbi:MAG: PilZ domain-containing protein [Syntrophotaleaceae bacterium]
MKRVLIGDDRDKLLATLETILKHWGYRALASSSSSQLLALLQETEPDLLIMGEKLLKERARPLREEVFHFAAKGVPLLILCKGADPFDLNVPHESLSVPLDIFTLFELVQKYLEKYPRKNIRLPMKLPGMLCLGRTCHLAEVLSLSTKGLFIKTGFRLKEGERFHIAFPLMGMKREVELEGKVLYCVNPDPENNFLQGIGVEFTSLDEKTLKDLQTFIESCFLEGLPRQLGERLVLESQKTSEILEPTLRLISPAQLKSSLYPE